MAAVTQAEVACLVHSWLIQQGFAKTASTFVIEAKHHLQTISVHGSIRSLENILSDYAKLKEAETQKNKMQKVFLSEDDDDYETNKEIFIDIWNSFTQLLEDYKDFKSNEHKRQSGPPRKRRRLSDCNDFDQHKDANQNLFELNPGRFNEILNNKALHEKMAQLISTQFNKNTNEDGVVDKMLAIDESQFEELFVPLPLDQYQNQANDEEKSEQTSSNT